MTEVEVEQFYAERTKKSLATRALNKEKAAIGTANKVLGSAGEIHEYRKSGLDLTYIDVADVADVADAADVGLRSMRKQAQSSVKEPETVKRRRPSKFHEFP